MYLGMCAGRVYPVKDVDSEKMCGHCGERPAAWGDWLCEQCRRKLDEVWKEAREHLVGAAVAPK